MKDYEIEMRETISKIMEMYYINSVREQADYESEMIQMLCKLLDLAKTFGLCKRRNYRMREEQFNRYQWHIEHIGLKEFTVFKIIGDITKMVDNDEYYWKPKEELEDY